MFKYYLQRRTVMKRKSYIVSIIFILCLGLVLMGCPKKTVMKDDPSVAQKEAARQEAERLAKEKEVKEAERRDKEIREKEVAKLKEEEARRELERSLVAKKTPGIEGVVFESSLLKTIHFDFDRFDIRPQDADILKQNAEVLKRFPAVKIQIEGHCDDRGTNEYNLSLGERRANSTKNYLMLLGISRERLSTISYGEERPVDPGQNEEAWAKNRRAEFVITAK